jgi:hypothetical protein
VLLELNPNGTCSLNRTFDLMKRSCCGEWKINGGKIEIICNRNPVLSGIEKLLLGGGLIEGNIEIAILNKNKLKFGDVTLKRAK